MNIPFHKPYLGKEELNAATRVINSGLIGTGPFVNRFERLFGKYVGATHAIAVNSCTSALHLALVAAGIGPNDEVITTAVTFSSTVNVILYTGAKPVLVDVYQDDLCMDVSKIESKITKQTKAIIAVHYNGMAAQLDEIRKLCKKYSLVLIEDAAHAVATKYHGERIGKDYTEIPEMTCFSFQTTKNISIGDGGMITTSDDALAKKLRELRLFGMSEVENSDPALDATQRFRQTQVGYKYNMTDIEAAIGIEQLKKLETMNQMRKEVAAYYNEKLSRLPYVECPIEKDGVDKTWYIYVIRVKQEYMEENIQSKLINYLGKEGIQCSIHFLPIYQIPVMRPYFPVEAKECTVAENETKRIISLPFYPELQKEEIDFIVQSIQKFFEEQ